MIDDRIEEGLSEKEAVAKIGSVERIASQIIEDIPLTKIVKEKMRREGKPGALTLILLILGSPIWLSLAIAAFSVIISLWAVLWSLVISLWAVFVSLVATTLAGVAVGVFFSVGANTLTGLAMLSASAACAGFSILIFFGCKAATIGTLSLHKIIALGIKNRLARKG